METYSIKKRTSTVVIILIFIYFLMCNRCWLGFGGNKMLMTYLLPILLFISHMLGYMRLDFKIKYIKYSLIV